MTTEAAAERKAARENARRVDAAPLLAAAGLVPLTTPAEVEARRQRLKAEGRRRFSERDAGVLAQIEEFTAALGQAVAPVLAYCDRLQARGDLRLSLLGGALRRVRAGLPPLEETQRPLTPAEVDAGNERVRRLKALWLQVDADHPDLVAAASGEWSTAQQKAQRELGDLRRAAELRCGLAAPQAYGRLRITVGGAAQEVAAPGPQAGVPLDQACPACGAALEVGAGMTTDGVLFQAHCRACLARVGSVEVL